MDPFREGQPIWVEQSDGSQRAATFVGEAGRPWFGGEAGQPWFGGPTSVYVVYADTESGEQVSPIRVVPRDPEEPA